MQKITHAHVEKEKEIQDPALPNLWALFALADVFCCVHDNNMRVKFEPVEGSLDSGRAECVALLDRYT
jgi:hypothetical protein